MFHKIKNVMAACNYSLLVEFDDGTIKEYDLKRLIEQNEKFKKLKENELFYNAHIDVDRCGVIWDVTLDISSEEIWDNGELLDSQTIEVPNEKTLEAFKEIEEISSGKKNAKRYTIDDLRKELGVK